MFPKAKSVIFAGIITIIVCTTVIVVALRFYPSHHMLATPGSVRAFDSANRISDPNWFRKAYEDGFRLYVLHSTEWGSCTPWVYTQEQLKFALDAGLKVAAYTRDPHCWREGIEATGSYASKLEFFALDIETDPGIPLTRDMVDGVRGLGVRPVVYTGSGMWSEVQHGSQESFSDVPLWDADTSMFDYDTWQADYMSPHPVAYGGWNTSSTMRVGVQQRFEYTLHGINIDLNSFDSRFLK